MTGARPWVEASGAARKTPALCGLEMGAHTPRRCLGQLGRTAAAKRESLAGEASSAPTVGRRGCACEWWAEAQWEMGHGVRDRPGARHEPGGPAWTAGHAGAAPTVCTQRLGMDRLDRPTPNGLVCTQATACFHSEHRPSAMGFEKSILNCGTSPPAHSDQTVINSCEYEEYSCVRP